jgi:hypothetical protein
MDVVVDEYVGEFKVAVDDAVGWEVLEALVYVDGDGVELGLGKAVDCV